MRRPHPSWSEGYLTLAAPVAAALAAPWFVAVIAMIVAAAFIAVRWTS